jgi:hypothetical protein
MRGGEPKHIVGYIIINQDPTNKIPIVNVKIEPKSSFAADECIVTIEIDVEKYRSNYNGIMLLLNKLLGYLFNEETFTLPGNINLTNVVNRTLKNQALIAIEQENNFGNIRSDLLAFAKHRFTGTRFRHNCNIVTSDKGLLETHNNYDQVKQFEKTPYENHIKESKCSVVFNVKRFKIFKKTTITCLSYTRLNLEETCEGWSIVSKKGEQWIDNKSNVFMYPRLFQAEYNPQPNFELNKPDVIDNMKTKNNFDITISHDKDVLKISVLEQTQQSE